ncbi:MAG: hypothetical protein RBG13Loki_2644 [Promethearchaeota archaeon CR_4]|nr:MAG: hypothetical protein RBG13Loki_2644 [Candidatus Lokiarchaeota archaeon CR_4]
MVRLACQNLSEMEVGRNFKRESHTYYYTYLEVCPMTRRSLVQTIPRVPANLPAFLDALVTEILRSPRLGAGKQNHFEERLPRQGLLAILEPVGRKLPFNLTFFIELIPLANSVEIYLEIGLMGKGIIRLSKWFTGKMLDQMLGREIVECIERVLALESQNYGRPLREDTLLETRYPQTIAPPSYPPASVLYCPACGLANPAEAQFCQTCGTKLA